MNDFWKRAAWALFRALIAAAVAWGAWDALTRPTPRLARPAPTRSGRA